MSVGKGKTKAQKLIKAPKGKSLEELKQDYLVTNHAPAKKMLFLLIRKLDTNFKG